MGKELPPGVLEKYLAFSRYLGDTSEIAVTAYGFYLDRIKNNIPGSALEDWVKAEKIIGDKFILNINGANGTTHQTPAI